MKVSYKSYLCIRKVPEAPGMDAPCAWQSKKALKMMYSYECIIRKLF